MTLAARAAKSFQGSFTMPARWIQAGRAAGARRPLMSMLPLLLAVALGGGGAQRAVAGAPLQKTQAPGWYRMMLGEFEVTALSDGTAPFRIHDLFTHIAPTQIDADLAQAYLKEPVEFSVNAFLINTGSKLVLIDTGAGTIFGPSGGHLLTNLEAAGYHPEQVDEIYITHMHGDHIGGLTRNGQALFPRANVHCAQTEADYWLSDAQMQKAPADKREGFKTAMTAFKPYIDSKRYQPFRGNVDLLPGIKAVAAAGHTPGHTVYWVTSRTETLVAWGDLMHVAAVQFPDPTAVMKFDADAAAAIAERQKIFAEVAAHRDFVAGAHLSFPGIGHLRTDAPRTTKGGSAAPTSYTYVPIAYGVPQ
jgi:glyoxylase-like metal-dependent hydrolase (beta-lactamase superfamily II)